ncbi:MAG: hypothetical protein ACRDO9_05295, partial [Gaiellales bacterium]
MAKQREQEQVVAGLDGAGDDERCAECDRGQQRADQRPGRAGHVTRGTRVRRRRCPFVAVDEADDVGLAGRYVHLREGEAREQQGERGVQARCERDGGEQHVRGEVRYDHGRQEPGAGGHTNGGLERQRLQQADGEEARGEDVGVGVDAGAQPVGDEGVDDEAAAEAVVGKQQREPPYVR